MSRLSKDGPEDLKEAAAGLEWGSGNKLIHVVYIYTLRKCVHIHIIYLY